MKNEFRVILTYSNGQKTIGGWVSLNSKTMIQTYEFTKMLEEQGIEVNFEYR